MLAWPGSFKAVPPDEWAGASVAFLSGTNACQTPFAIVQPPALSLSHKLIPGEKLQWPGHPLMILHLMAVGLKLPNSSTFYRSPLLLHTYNPYKARIGA